MEEHAYTHNEIQQMRIRLEDEMKVSLGNFPFMAQHQQIAEMKLQTLIMAKITLEMMDTLPAPVKDKTQAEVAAIDLAAEEQEKK